MGWEDKLLDGSNQLSAHSAVGWSIRRQCLGLILSGCYQNDSFKRQFPSYSLYSHRSCPTPIKVHFHIGDALQDTEYCLLETFSRCIVLRTKVNFKVRRYHASKFLYCESLPLGSLPTR